MGIVKKHTGKQPCSGNSAKERSVKEVEPIFVTALFYGRELIDRGYGMLQDLGLPKSKQGGSKKSWQKSTSATGSVRGAFVLRGLHSTFRTILTFQCRNKSSLWFGI